MVSMFLMLGMTSPVETVYNNSKLDFLLTRCEKEGVQNLERESALKFHKLINKHRLQNKKSSLEWNNSLWLVSYNHNVWMSGNKKLSHSETKGTVGFTGIYPAERTAFVFVESVFNSAEANSYYGENVLSYVGDRHKMTADNIANTAFLQWKKSPGHNENMLDETLKVHGTAFKIAPDGRVWATDLFFDKINISVTVKSP